MELVEVKRSEIFCDSSLVAKKFGFQHKYVVERIMKTIEQLSKVKGGTACTPKCVEEVREYRGQKFTCYLMNRDFFTFLIMRFKGTKAIEWQLEFIAAFNAMERRILTSDQNATDPEWLGVRAQGKISRLQETDVIKEFVDYATLQGSKSAKFYYKHITNATYAALGMMVQRQPKLRDTMNLYEVSELLLAERMARNSLQKYMALGRDYKDIYISVKNDLMKFGSGLKMIEGE
jgi:Rha family phage regulatory protein